MKIKLFLPIILLASSNALCNAQNKLTIDLNLLRDDSLLKRNIKKPGTTNFNYDNNKKYNYEKNK